MEGVPASTSPGLVGSAGMRILVSRRKFMPPMQLIAEATTSAKNGTLRGFTPNVGGFACVAPTARLVLISGAASAGGYVLSRRAGALASRLILLLPARKMPRMTRRGVGASMLPGEC